MPPTYSLSCCIWVLSGPETDILKQIKQAGFNQIDVQPSHLRTPANRAQAQALGLHVGCVAVSFGMPEGASLDNVDPAARSQAQAHMTQAMQHGAELGASAAYLVPGLDGSPAALDRFAQALIPCADQAADLGLKLCIEHFPGRALPTVSATLAFLRTLDHPNLYLLFDIGHVQISGEDPAQAIKTAGARLGYVHLDDNDGRNDSHLSLLEGAMTEAYLRQTFAALDEIGYNGAVSIELNPNLPNPLAAISQSREIVSQITQIA